MSINSFRIRLKYKHNKFNQKDNKYINGVKFEGGELVELKKKKKILEKKRYFYQKK